MSPPFLLTTLSAERIAFIKNSPALIKLLAESEVDVIKLLDRICTRRAEGNYKAITEERAEWTVELPERLISEMKPPKKEHSATKRRGESL